MTSPIVSLVFCASLMAQGCVMRSSIAQLAGRSENQEPVFKVKGISAQEAVAIANEDVMKRHEPLTDLSSIACETGLFWKVIYDGAELEYVINKQTAKVMSLQRVPHSPTESNGEKGLTRKDNSEVISEQEAVSIAMRDMSESAYGEDMGKFAAFACELNEVWRVFVEIKLEPGSNGEAPIIPFASTPNYVIDKQKGQIIFKSRN